MPLNRWRSVRVMVVPQHFRVACMLMKSVILMPEIRI
ncbi:hypothetical protein BMETH_2577_0 [methanotrophic bacterial endosymbiont of Bathymodiolus sp.]|nr:hypothetical protein BMETH_2577_0 [methanotrophic bacterial endosymbiont of Bathymodiolus sp.]